MATRNQPPKAYPFKVEYFDDIMLDKPEVEVIEGVLPARGVVHIYGPSGYGKTFVAVDMFIRVAGGIPWHGRRVEKKPVVYFYLEACGGLKRRLKAWNIENPGLFPKGEIAFVRKNSIKLIEQWRAIVPLVPKGGVVVIVRRQMRPACCVSSRIKPSFRFTPR